MIDKSVEAVLEQARRTYGDTAQILVCIEELNELACVLAKYPRYDNACTAITELHQKTVDELADVTICTSHIKAILQISDEELTHRIKQKSARLKKWLDTGGTSTQITVDERNVPEI